MGNFIAKDFCWKGFRNTNQLFRFPFRGLDYHRQIFMVCKSFNYCKFYYPKWSILPVNSIDFEGRWLPMCFERVVLLVEE